MTTLLPAVSASAPTRVCDCGGWTDTWFARHGTVCHVAVEPRVFVEVTTRARSGPCPVAEVDAPNLGARIGFVIGRRPFGPHPLIEATIEAAGVPDAWDLGVRIHSDMPPGASTGTSAAVCVALSAALDRLSGREVRPADLAAAAHRIETERLAWQSGVQDQVAAAFGGINVVRIADYPGTAVQPLRPSRAWLDDLDARLLLVYLGRSHQSSDVHEAVIRDAGVFGASYAPLAALRACAGAACDAVRAEDIAAYGAALVANTEAQRALHPALIGADAALVIAAAQAAGALGWKVNGAGGGGGTVSVLAGNGEASRRRVEEAVMTCAGGFRLIPVRCARGGVVVTIR